MGLTRDSHRVRRVSTSPLLLGAPEGSCLRLELAGFGVRGGSRVRPGRHVSVPESSFLIRVAPSKPAKLVPFQPGANIPTASAETWLILSCIFHVQAIEGLNLLALGCV